MEKEVMVILGSARKESDTRKFIDQIFYDYRFSLVDLLDFPVSPYNYDHIYPPVDLFYEIAEMMIRHNTLVIATPIYWYTMSGSIKQFMDRFTDLITVNKELGRRLKNRNLLVLSVGAEEQMPDGFEVPFRSTAKYFSMNYKGCLYFKRDYQLTAMDKTSFKEMIKFPE